MQPSTKLLTMPELHRLNYMKKINSSEYNRWLPFKNSPYLELLPLKMDYLFKEGGLSTTKDYVDYFELKSKKHERGLACLLGLGIADALGATTQFIDFKKDRKHLIEKGFAEIRGKIQKKVLNPRGRIGVWTDDCSMALCLADSLLFNNFKLDPLDLRHRFILWLMCGLNNGGRPHSIGLGGNISVSMDQFWTDNTKKYANAGDRFNNGNGSLMRMAPAVTAYIDSREEAIKVSEQQSWTTHNGQEASQCCKLLADILHSLINRPEDKNPKEVIDQVCSAFKSKLKQVEFLAQSKVETLEMFQKAQHQNEKFKKFNKSPEQDRNWNWRNKDFTYSEARNKHQPEYIGSYCMDALSMALHISYHTDNFYDAVLWAVNMGGDSDTVGAIVGQITGAMYGLSDKMLMLYSEMPDCYEKRYHLFVVGKMLAQREKP